jgi:hypothetical protein
LNLSRIAWVQKSRNHSTVPGSGTLVRFHAINRSMRFRRDIAALLPVPWAALAEHLGWDWRVIGWRRLAVTPERVLDVGAKQEQPDPSRLAVVVRSAHHLGA